VDARREHPLRRLEGSLELAGERLQEPDPLLGCARNEPRFPAAEPLGRLPGKPERGEHPDRLVALSFRHLDRPGRFLPRLEHLRGLDALTLEHRLEVVGRLLVEAMLNLLVATGERDQRRHEQRGTKERGHGNSGEHETG
jgi:hypothetical protein